MRFKRIDEIVKESNCTKQQIADAIGITTKQLKRYQDGEQEPSASKIIAICKYFRVSADWLLELEVEEEKKP